MLALKKILTVIAVLMIAYGTWLMIKLSLPYTTFERYTDFLRTKQMAWHVKPWRISFYIHVFVSSIVLLAGLLQFSSYLLHHYPKLHRSLGKTYAVVVIFISGPSGLVMALYANGGPAAKTSFVVLSVLWIGVTVMGWKRALQRRWEDHQQWMLRSYALTLSALTLRFYVFLMGTLHMQLHPRTAYVMVSWLSWTINILLAEIYIYYSRRRLAQR
ncbi:DUF2306 domain-containing protein [Chitinophaga sp. sic0106]|uniref:DUF2306 domain-containing protein n=1 Tax=Chitinophaga sp. sic0106 TaxID=2854785 RepID=UPI001C4677B5|nr:DUF2306 domain-containing protein [Chitinophaga sp. sic0106]MBV7528771.1 DUF2306 domain-containing protein [Chitinophaga sp. sic0106]